MIKNIDYVVCPLCNKKFKSLMSHITGYHKQTIESFLEQFPNTLLVSSSTKHKVSVTCKQRKCGRTSGFIMSNDQKKKISIANGGINNGFFGKKHSLHTKKLMSKHHADFNGEKNPLKRALTKNPSLHYKLSSLAKKRWNQYTPQERELISQKCSLTLANSEFTKKHKYHLFHRSGWFKGKKCKRCFFRSSWERAVCEFLENNDNIINFSLESLVIPYINSENKQRNTRIDFIAILKNNIKVMIDVKPEALINYNQNYYKMQAYKEYCKNNNIIYFLYSNNDINILDGFIHGMV